MFSLKLLKSAFTKAVSKLLKPLRNLLVIIGPHTKHGLIHYTFDNQLARCTPSGKKKVKNEDLGWQHRHQNSSWDLLIFQMQNRSTNSPNCGKHPIVVFLSQTLHKKVNPKRTRYIFPCEEFFTLGIAG